MTKIPQNYIKPIKILQEKLKDSDIEWYITGKTNLAIQGIDIQPKRIGILIHEKDLEKFLKLFSEYKKTKIILLENKEAKEFTMYVDGVEVMVCAEYSHGAYWEVFEEQVMLKLDDITIPCFNLNSEKKAYLRLGMNKKVKIIEQWQQKN